MKRLFIIAAAILVAVFYSAANDIIGESAEILDGYNDISIVKERMKSSPLHVIEGIWQFPDDGAIVAIERFSTPEMSLNSLIRYRMVILRSPVRSVFPGTIMGVIAPTAKKGVYSADIYTDSDGGSRLFKAKSFKLHLEDNHRLMFRKQGLKLSINTWRLFPYIYRRLGLRISKESKENTDGCVRIFPVPDSGVLEPVYL